jgi:D-glutamate cyclase
MNDVLDRMRDIVQEDVGNRGLGTVPDCNLISTTRDDFPTACRSLADAPSPALAIVTGFFIPTADPPAGETDGPLGAVFLARALLPLGFRVAIATDAFCVPALQAGLAACGLRDRVIVIALPSPDDARAMTAESYNNSVRKSIAGLELTHLLAIERVGPSHVRAEVPAEHQDRCHTMRGRDITDLMSPAHWLFEAGRGEGGPTTIGIGDGGNEIGMGKIPWEVIQRNIPRGGLVACRVPTDHLIVAGVSNWGAYALAAGIYALCGAIPDPRLFDPDEELRLLKVMVEGGPLVDGVLGQPSATVDGLRWEQYSAVLPKLAAELDRQRA